MLRLLLSALFCLCLSQVVKADQFVITQGAVSVTGHYRFGTTISGGGFSMDTVISYPLGTVPADINCPCAPGSLVALSASTWTIGPTDFPGGPFFSVNGVGYTINNASSSLQFATGLAEIPLSGDFLVTVQAPFSFNGRFIGVASGNSIVADLTGSGIAEMTLQLGVDQFGNPAYRRQSITYTFQTPEPMTLLLLGTGLAGIAGRALKRRGADRR